MKSWVITTAMTRSDDDDAVAGDSIEKAFTAAMAEVDFNAASGKRSKLTIVFAVQPVTEIDGGADPAEEDPVVVEVVVEDVQEGGIKVRREFSDNAVWLNLEGIEYIAAHDDAPALVILPRDLAIYQGLL